MTISKYPEIYGLNKNSEMGLSVFAPTIFLKGCNLRCPYCMNASLVNGKASDIVKIKDVEEYVKSNGVEWVSISGGEPTLQGPVKLNNLFKLIKSWRCKISMSTNGTHPEVLKKIICNLNYVALDIKSPRNSDYSVMSSADDFLHKIKQSKSLLTKHLKSTHEIRTTLFPSFICKQTLNEIGKEFIKKNDTWILQQYRPVKGMFSAELTQYNESELKALVDIAKKYSDNVGLRFV